jgi:putative ABC transport system permease protein
MDIIWQDVKYGFRALRKSKGIIAVAIISLAIGIGANTTIFSAVDVFMLQPLPFFNDTATTEIYTTNQERGWTTVSYSVPDLIDLRHRSQSMDVAAADGASFNLSGGDRPERLSGRMVTANFFRVVGIQPAMGRSFTRDEEREGQDRVAIISDGLWHRRFGADPAVLGTTMTLDGDGYTVVGVMPPKFWWGRDTETELWVPMGFTGEESRSSHYIEAYGRLKDGATHELAQQEAYSIAQQLAAEYPESNTGMGARLVAMRDAVFDEGFKSGSLISTVAVAFVLLIACANVANLLLTHAAGRDREVALRGALGANRSRIVRQFLTEAVIVSLVGGLLGLGISVFGIRALVSLMPPDFPRVTDIHLSGRVLLFTAGVSILTGIIFGLAPALESSKSNVVDALKEGGRGGTAGKSAKLRKALVVGEVSLALVLLVSSALLVKGFARVMLTDLGFDRSDVLTLRLTLPKNDYPDTASVAAFHHEIKSRFEAIPGVQAASATTILPLQGGSGTYYTLPGEEVQDDSQRKIAAFRYILPQYFDAMDMTLLRGRDFEATDKGDMPRVIVVNETLAERHWSEDDPLGKQILFGSGPREIIGVVSDARYGDAEDAPDPMVYFPILQGAVRSVSWAIETTGPPTDIVPSVRAEILSVDSNLPAYNVRSLEDAVALSLGGDTIMAKIMAVLALVALVLALGGVYGVMAYMVSQRTQELGIRMALGAQTKDVMAMVVRQGTKLSAIGVVVGLAVALGVTRGLAFFLHGVSPFDPVTFSTVGIVLLVAGVAAAYFPARRATKVDPIVALHNE